MSSPRNLCVVALMGFLMSLTSATSYAQEGSSGAASVPVLVELFTSEGCSSCPPADALLQQLDQTQPVPGAKIIALSEHVDYWNHDGWTDPFSSSDYTDRQKQYVAHFKLQSGYTPQMVVDGSAELTGNDSAKAQAAIDKARQVAKVAVIISGAKNNGKDINLHLASAAISGTSVPKSLDVIVVAASPEETRQVRAGENGGKTLRHIDVVRSLKRVASIHHGEAFARDLTIKAPSASGKEVVLIAFLQDSSTGRVWGAASERVTN